MISSLETLKQYLAEIKNYMQLRGIKVSNKSFEISEKIDDNFLRKKFDNIPDTYMNVLKKINLFKLDIGCFAVSPYRPEDSNITDSLIKFNTDETKPFYSFLKHKELLCVGSWDGDGSLICVRMSSKKDKSGEVVRIDDYINWENPEDDYIYNLAKDYTQFLIIAGNLNQIHREIKEDESNYEEKAQEFFERLKILEVPEEYHQAWKIFL